MSAIPAIRMSAPQPDELGVLPQLRLFIERVPSAMALFDTEMRYLAHSEKWCTDYGLDPEASLVGRSHYDVFPEIGGEWKAVHQRCLAGDTERRELDPFPRADGTMQHLRYEVRPWHTAEGEIGGLVMLTEDLSPAVAAAQTIHQQQALLDVILREAPMVLFAYAPDGTTTLSVGRTVRELGMGQNESVGSNVFERFADAPHVTAAMRRAAAGEPAQYRFAYRGRHLDVVLHPIEADGTVSRVVGVGVDVTHRVEAEARVELEAERLRRLLRVTARDGEFEDRARAVLTEMTDLLGLDGGLLARIDDGVYEVLAGHARSGETLAPGTQLPLGDTYCDLTMELDDVVAIPHMAESPHREHRCYEVVGLEAYIGVPIWADGERVGALSFSSPRPAARPFTPTDISLMRLAGQWAGSLIEREHRQAEAVRHAARLRALAGATARRGLAFDEHVAHVLRVAAGLLGLDTGILSRIDADAGTYTVRHVHTPEGVDLPAGSSFRLGETYCAITLGAKDVVAIDHMGVSPHRRHPCYAAFGLESYIGVPVAVGGATWGTLNFSASDPTVRPFDDSDRDLMRVLAEWIGGAVERDRTQAELAAALDAAETANRAKSAFFAAMSHEIRTPLNAVIGFGELLATTPLTDQQRDYVATVQRAGERLLGLIDDVLSFSKVEAGHLELESEPFELEAVALGALEQLAPRAAEKGIELAYVPDDALPPRLVGDAGRLSQVLTNLVSNAVKFTEAGTVELETRLRGKHRDGGGADAVEVEVVVRDSGIGIAPERRDAIFEAFVQEDASTARRFGGTGLGLAISRRIAEQMGGTLTVESTPGEGSAFTVRVRLAAPQASARRVLTRAATGLSGTRVLLVDDDDGGREVLTAQMERWGMQVAAAATAEQALAWLDEGREFELGVLDMVLDPLGGGGDGIALAEAIAERRTAQQMPLVLLSSEESARFAPHLAVSTALKPLPTAQLFTLLTRALAVRSGVRGVVIESAMPGVAHDAPAGPIRILLAEDEPDNQRLAIRMLRELGYDAEVAANGAEVLDRLRQARYDFVLMDVMMPGMDGLEATRRLRAELPPEQQPRVVALTAKAMRSDREACFDAGMDDYIPKPFRLRALAEALRRGAPRAHA